MIVILGILLAITVAIIAGYVLFRWYKCDGDLMLMFYERFGQGSSILKHKVIWIVGASTGIGEELALECAVVGARLIISATSEDKLQAVKRKCLTANKALDESDILVLPLDITNTDGHQAKLDQVLKQFKKVDILVNNAGRFQVGQFETIDLSVDKSIFDVNVFGPINLSRLMVKHWLENGSKGHLAVTSSGFGVIGAPASSAYAATKHALHGYFDSARPELASRGIVVSTVCPGPVATPLLDKSFTSQLTKQAGPRKQSSALEAMTMTAERCAKLYAICLANQVTEAWLIKQPALAAIYFGVHLPNVFQFLMARYMTEDKVREMAHAH
ncbi:Dehydrogenase/reductase SDR family member 7 [Halotydeus destructor]|nr:Dehydrogenase/reductase SDR family member 7 [Halotydeus destructor]